MATRRGGPNGRSHVEASKAVAGGPAVSLTVSLTGGPGGDPAGSGTGWDAVRVRHLRRFLGASQAELAERLGTRQQTVSEWETGGSRPRRMSRRLLHLVAETSGYYDADPASAGDGSAGAGPAGDGAGDGVPAEHVADGAP
jgi:hypothetical protein